MGQNLEKWQMDAFGRFELLGINRWKTLKYLLGLSQFFEPNVLKSLQIELFEKILVFFGYLSLHVFYGQFVQVGFHGILIFYLFAR